MSATDPTAATGSPRYVVQVELDDVFLDYHATDDLADAVTCAVATDDRRIFDHVTGQPVDLKAQQHRLDVIAGLRQLIAFLERHPELPLQNAWSYAGRDYNADTDGARLLAIASAIDRDDFVVRQDYPSTGTVQLRVEFDGGVHFTAEAPRDGICTPRIEDGCVVWDLPEVLAEGAEVRS